MCCGNASMKWRQAGVYRFFAGGPFWATAAFTSALNAPASTFSPSWMSIALRVLPAKLELKRPDGSGILAPRANVSFTTFVYVSPVHTIPWCDQTGVPLHFHSSVISGSASRISARMRARVSPRHPPRSRIRCRRSGEAGFPVAASPLPGPARTAPSTGSVPLCLSEPRSPRPPLRWAGLPPARTTATFSPFRTLIGLASLAPGLAVAPACAGPLLVVAGFRYGKLARSFLDAIYIAAIHTTGAYAMQLSGESSAPGALTYTAVRTGDVGAHRAAMLLHAARPTSAPAG